MPAVRVFLLGALVVVLSGEVLAGSPGTTTTSTTSTTTDESTTTSTTTPGETTTTTTLPGECASVPSGPTFASLNCRLAALIAQVNASTELGTARQQKLSASLAKAKLRKEGAEAKCAESKTPAVRGQLIKAALRVVGVKKRLGQTSARREVPEALRTELTETLNGLQTDLRALRKGIRCPDDAAS
jgi:hypothetical protein